MALFFSILIYIHVVPHICSQSVDVLIPVIDNGTDAALIIAPGAYIRGSAYKPLAEEIQRQSPLKLWIVILDDFIDNLVNPFQLGHGVSEGIEKLQQNGFPNNGPVFIAGHSLGGTFVSLYAKSHAKQLSGALLFASYLTRGNRLKDYPIPVLTISGEMDGLTRITRILITYEEWLGDISNNSSAKYKTPVIVVKGINHGLFASGVMPSEVINHDFYPDVTIDVAHKTIAKYASAFITATLLKNDEDSRKMMDEAFLVSYDLLRPLQDVKAIDENNHMKSFWTNTAETFIIQITNESKLNLQNEEQDEKAFLKFAPLVEKNDATGRCVLTSYTNVVHKPNPFDVTTDPLSPLELQSKMADQRSVMKILPNDTFSSNRITCKDINVKGYESALQAVPIHTLLRYKTQGNRIHFNDDIIVGNEMDWLIQQLHLDYYNEGLNVTSVLYLDESTGKFYCKLLSPYRAIEWIYLDSNNRG